MAKVNSISPKYVLSILGAIAYIIFCLVFDVHKGVTFIQTNARHQSQSKDSGISLKTEQKLISEGGYTSIQNQIVVVDSLIYRIDRNERGSFLVGNVICDNNNRIVIRVAMSDEEADEYASIVFKKVRLRASLNKIISLPYEKELYTFDDELIWHRTYYDYVLEGSLEEIISIESYT